MKKIFYSVTLALFGSMLCPAVNAQNTTSANEPTHLRLHLKSGEMVEYAVDNIDSLTFGTKSLTSQLPYFGFSANDDNAIAAHEAALGRILKDSVNINQDSSEEPNVMPAYVNLDLDVIPVVVYGISYPGLHKEGIMALGKEPYGNCPKLYEMFAQAGFVMKDSNEICTQWEKDDIEILVQSWVNTPLGTNVSISIMHPMAYDPVAKEHDPIATVKDLLPFEVLLSGDKQKVAEFEANLGMRDLTSENDTYTMYSTKADKKAETNLTFVFYWLADHKITGKFNCLSSVDEAMTSEALHAWATANGFTGEWKRGIRNGESCAIVTGSKATLTIFNEYGASMKFEITEIK